ncbi:MAG: tetratricopeptide repeat protein [Candidatus Eremiobacteraeota bacterium]|nr:tetratricopeptide repeat protein [Candidatus Eremiobacteraeota bacterium]MCW5867416.1 tetratricopeptide repeat protein [Candidatus Eremiobacteraeota bacterium]
MNEERWELFNQLGMQAYQNGEWEQAVQAFEVTVEEAAKLDPPDLRLARGLNNLACALSHQGQIAQSVGLQEQALGLSHQLLGPDHQVIAAGMLNLASDYAKLGRVAEAEQLFKSALTREMATRVRVQAMENLTQFYMAQQKLPEASEVLQELVRIQGDSPQSRAKALHMLTHIYDATGQKLQADTTRAQTLALIEDLWGAQTLAYAEVVANMAESLMAQERLADAAELYAKAIPAFAGCVPADDARLAGCRLGQLICLRDSGQLEKAAQVGKDAPDQTRRWLNEYGLVLFLQERFDEAAELFQRSLELPETLTQAARISVLFNLGSAHMGARRREQALPILENIASLAEEHLGAEHELTLRIWVQLRELYRILENPDGEAAIGEKLARHSL